MKRLVLTMLVGGVLAAAAVAAASPQRHPALRLARDAQTLVVYGSGFYASERVHVRVIGTTQQVRTLRTRPAGTFAAHFASTSVNACDALFVQAVGRRGDRARLKIPPRACLPVREP